jgi:hypothetical protein
MIEVGKIAGSSASLEESTVSPSSTHEELWAGPYLKLQYAEFHLQKMGQSLEGPPRDQHSVAMQAAGAIIDTGWQRSIYPYLDAFLSTTRSIPEIIQCCFGVDAATGRKNNKMKDWFDHQLSSEEKHRRRQFKAQFNGDYSGFRSRRLSEVRHNIEHRTGVAPATVTIKGAFGDTHKGSPTQQVPISETRQMDDPTAALLLAKPHPIQPRWSDFEIEGKPLFAECREHLIAANALVEKARKVAELVHGRKQVSIPPIY